jgi:hypothetical protein
MAGTDPVQDERRARRGQGCSWRRIRSMGGLSANVSDSPKQCSDPALGYSVSQGLFCKTRSAGARWRVSALIGPARAAFGPRLFINFLFLFLAGFGNLS